MLHSPRYPERNILLETADARAEYTKLLLNDFHALEALIAADAFEKGVTRIGYELELNFVDRQLNPACIGNEIVTALNDPRFTPEFARFNLELNSKPVVLGGRCFAQLHSSIGNALAQVRDEAAKRDCSLLLTGIVPTLTKAHITPGALTPEPRYEALYQFRRALKGDDYEYRIEGIDELLTRDNVALFAGSVTSFQVHQQIDVANFVDAYNWAQLLAAPVLACAVNSPLFLGKRLWQETRIELFEQATDTRQPDLASPRNRPRVFFGDGWVRESILELMQEDILGFEPFLCGAETEDPQHALNIGRVPRLDAWTVFNGTIYRWNRVCYGHSRGNGDGRDKPALRIEARMLPSGPTVEDMVANAAFWSGALAALPARYRNVQQRFDFSLAKENFFKAARYGLDVEFAWFDRHVSARELILDELLPFAREGLQAAGVDEDDAARYLDVVRARTASGKTGAKWLLGSFNALRRHMTPEQTLHAVTAGMLARQESGKPVHQWETMAVQEDRDGSAADPEALVPGAGVDCVQRIMTSELFKVSVDDALDLVAHLMQWKHVGHVPVENADGRFVGMITRDKLLEHIMRAAECGSTALLAGDVMSACEHCVGPHTPLGELVTLMADRKLACVPVLDKGCVIGLVTEHELVRVTQLLLARQ
ncbi:MAG: CBS domain-containing protein, partial [Pseudomonadota bacterium]|nr:CBS domain-containing protein [Pseudomonadota bacterium]